MFFVKPGMDEYFELTDEGYEGSPKHSVQIMTGTGSGYIGNGCVLNPFAGITLLYLHDSFPFIEAYSVPHCTPANQPESNPLITP